MHLTNTQLDIELSKAQKWNIHLSKMLQELQYQVQLRNQKPAKKDQGLSVINKQKQKQAEKNNLQKLLKIYEHDYCMQEETNIQALVKEMKELQKSVNQKHQTKNKIELMLRGIQNEIKKFNKKKKHEKKQSDLSDCSAQLTLLKKKLQGLTTRKITTQKVRQPKRRSVSTSHMQIGVNESQQHAKPQKINKKKMYKNLISYYQKQEQKLKQEVEQLQISKKKQNQEIQKVAKVIKHYEDKIKLLKRGGLKTQTTLWQKVQDQDKKAKQQHQRKYMSRRFRQKQANVDMNIKSKQKDKEKNEGQQSKQQNSREQPKIQNQSVPAQLIMPKKIMMTQRYNDKNDQILDESYK